MKIKVNESLKQAILKNTPITKMFSDKVLRGLTDSIISDEYENLSTRQSWEIEEFFEEVEDFDSWSEYRQELLFDSKAKEWGLHSTVMTVGEWLGAFIDYVEYQEGADEEYEAFMSKLESATVEVKL